MSKTNYFNAIANLFTFGNLIIDLTYVNHKELRLLNQQGDELLQCHLNDDYGLNLVPEIVDLFAENFSDTTFGSIFSVNKANRDKIVERNQMAFAFVFGTSQSVGNSGKYQSDIQFRVYLDGNCRLEEVISVEFKDSTLAEVETTRYDYVPYAKAINALDLPYIIRHFLTAAFNAHVEHEIPRVSTVNGLIYNFDLSE